jgi:dTDP-glucose pyrophosphorylase
MNILIPMAGSGSRFVSAGYSLPKPLIDVFGSPMIKVVLDSVSIDANYIFVVQRSHRVEYNLDGLLGLMVPGCKIVEVDGVTEGAACTTLLAREFIDNDEPLMLVNSDQFVDWDSTEFMYRMIEQGLDGGIVTFTATHPKWSFVRLDDNGFVVEVAEKNPISNIATAGFYYWSRGSDYVRCAERMIDRNIRVNNEFYVCPVYNEGIAEGLKFKTFEARRMCGLGTPEDLELFLSGGVVG